MLRRRPGTQRFGRRNRQVFTIQLAALQRGAALVSMDDDNGMYSKPAEEDASLPKGAVGSVIGRLLIQHPCLAATIAKIIKELLPKEIRCAKDSQDLILDAAMGSAPLAYAYTTSS
jgi:hypothetical protein